MTKDQQADNNWNEHTFELFKLEYELAAQRYENIYRAIWQIFQYMALLAAGILTFASKSSAYSNEFIFFCALTPLVFWFLAIYIPMDRYGEKNRQRLAAIESEINLKFQQFWIIKHYQDFASSDKRVNHFNLLNKLTLGWRVKHIVYIFGFVAIILWIISLIFMIKGYSFNF